MKIYFVFSHLPLQTKRESACFNLRTKLRKSNELFYSIKEGQAQNISSFDLIYTLLDNWILIYIEER